MACPPVPRKVCQHIPEQRCRSCFARLDRSENPLRTASREGTCPNSCRFEPQRFHVVFIAVSQKLPGWPALARTPLGNRATMLLGCKGLASPCGRGFGTRPVTSGSEHRSNGRGRVEGIPSAYLASAYAGKRHLALVHPLGDALKITQHALRRAGVEPETLPQSEEGK